MDRATALTPSYAPRRVAGGADPGDAERVPDLDSLLSAASEVAGDATLLAEVDGIRLTAGEVEARVARLAGGLAAAGVGPGAVVAWQLPNRHEAVLLPRACWRLGAVAAPLHPRTGRAEVERAVATLDPQVRVAAPGAPLADLAGTTVLGDARRPGLADGAPITSSERPTVGPDALAAVLFTSGSSGTPKAVLLDRWALAAKARVMVGVHDLGPDDAVLMPAPLAHVSGLLNGVLVPGAAPFRSLLMERWDPERALETIEAERITFMVGPPTFFVGLMDAPGFEPDRVASLRLVSCGGAGVSETFVREASTRLGALVKRTYGSTEAPTVATSHAGDDPDRAARYDGRAVGAVELSVRDPATGERRPAGAPGELWVRGPELFRGYADPTETAAAVHDGWFRTGDLATVDASGWLTIIGRLKDVIIRGGENIAAAEVEGVLEDHPAVRQAVAVGYADRTLGERVCAFLVASPEIDLDAVQTWFADQGIARIKTPERVVTVDALPMLASGKPDRAALRSDAARRFGTETA